MPVENKNSFMDVIEGIQGAGFMAFQMIFWPLTLKRRNRWGATDEEINTVLPGDDLVPTPKVGYTHAISITRSKDQVWPWLVKLGQGRGGFYSYQWLENIIGCQIYNADEIFPEYQEMEQFTGIKLHPSMPEIPIKSYKPQEYILLHGDSQFDQINNSGNKNFLNVTWLFHLREVGPDHSRLISRWRADFPNTFAAKMGYGAPITGSMAHVMDVKMLKGIKHRVEKS